MFHSLRKHRRLVSLAIVAALLLWLSAALMGCLQPPIQHLSPPAAAAMADMQPAAGMMGSGPCADGPCLAMQDNRPLVADKISLAATPKLLLVALLLTVILIAAPNSQRTRAAAPEPPLPKRSPLLRFYALRI